METVNYTFRTKLFRQAWTIYRETGKSFAVCLAKAWALYRLKRSMLKGVVKFAYEKLDGSLRIAYGTLQNQDNKVKGTKPASIKTFNYYDVEAEAFRCFRIENLITVY